MVERYKPKSESTILIPDAAQTDATHRFGKVVAVGQGTTKEGKLLPNLVKEDEVIFFQMNQVMEATQKYAREGKAYMNMLQTEVIGKLKSGDRVAVDNVEMAGDYVLLKHFVKEQEGRLLLPDSLIRQNAAEFIYFRVVKMGPEVTKPFKVGDEVIVNFGRLTPIFFMDGKPAIQPNRVEAKPDTQEYAYTTQDWIDGVVE
jgi:co-chaperonin GroES (HSP10)